MKHLHTGPMRALGYLLLVTALLAAGAWAGGSTTRWHWAGSGAAALTADSLRLLSRLDGEVVLAAAVPEGHLLRRHLRRLGAAYQRHYEHFRLVLLDSASRPEAARGYGLRNPGDMVLVLDGRREPVQLPTEAGISTALERLLRGRGSIVAYLTGHGERDLQGRANFDLGRLGVELMRRGYRLQPLSLARTPVIPDNTAVLVVASPRQPLLPGERALIAEYLAGGGRLLWITEPDDPMPAMLPVERLPGVLVDPQAEAMLGVDDARLVLVDAVPRHPVARGVAAPLLLSQAAALASGAAEGWVARPLLRTPDRVWAAQDFSVGTPPSQGAGEPGGPLTAGLALTRTGEHGMQRVAVLGDGDLFSNTYLGNGGNLAFALNLFDWLTGAEGYIGSYTAASPDQRLKFSRAEVGLIGFGFLLALPGTLLAAAAWAWRRRRLQ